MKDAFGNELTIGDRVVYIRKEYSHGPVKLAKLSVKDIVGRVPARMAMAMTDRSATIGRSWDD